ncbi:hypothetical protein SEA_BUMBLE_55 [Arthrobacter phage Bumble]|uniref:Uncharacterized protein n=1 Tax=Arthrobacter phage Bumble TaxID=2743904 RepID=A0A7G3VAD9_9CAUD|nr:hypothetical protein SEA_BUMBLE_55 [Arthrobacter phage Bumble]
MTELPYQPIPYVAGFINPDGHDRDAAAHELVLELSRLLGPGPTDRVVIESYFEPQVNGWRMVAHRVPARPGTPETPEETRARVTLALESALNSEEGRAIAAAILERKRTVAELDARSAPRPDDVEVYDGATGTSYTVPAPGEDYVRHLPADDEEAEAQRLARISSRGDGPALA